MSARHGGGGNGSGGGYDPSAWAAKRRAAIERAEQLRAEKKNPAPDESYTFQPEISRRPQEGAAGAGGGMDALDRLYASSGQQETAAASASQYGPDSVPPPRAASDGVVPQHSPDALTREMRHRHGPDGKRHMHAHPQPQQEGPEVHPDPAEHAPKDSNGKAAAPNEGVPTFESMLRADEPDQDQARSTRPSWNTDVDPSPLDNPVGRTLPPRRPRRRRPAEPGKENPVMRTGSAAAPRNGKQQAPPALRTASAGCHPEQSTPLSLLKSKIRSRRRESRRSRRLDSTDSASSSGSSMTARVAPPDGAVPHQLQSEPTPQTGSELWENKEERQAQLDPFGGNDRGLDNGAPMNVDDLPVGGGGGGGGGYPSGVSMTERQQRQAQLDPFGGDVRSLDNGAPMNVDDLPVGGGGGGGGGQFSAENAYPPGQSEPAADPTATKAPTTRSNSNGGPSSGRRARPGRRRPGPVPATGAASSTYAPPAGDAATLVGKAPPGVSELPGDEPQSLIPCSVCGRRFSEVAHRKHEQICAQASQKRRDKFDSRQMRAQGTELQATSNRARRGGRDTRMSHNSTPVGSAAQQRAASSKWRQQSAQFREAIRAARGISRAEAAGVPLSSLPPPAPAAEDPSFVRCPHCDRTYNETAAARHIPKCKDIIAKPKPPPRRANAAVNRAPGPTAAGRVSSGAGRGGRPSRGRAAGRGASRRSGAGRGRGPQV